MGIDKSDEIELLRDEIASLKEEIKDVRDTTYRRPSNRRIIMINVMLLIWLMILLLIAISYDKLPFIPSPF